MEHTLKIIFEAMSIVTTILYVTLYILIMREVKRLKKQRNFLVHSLLTHIKNVAIQNEHYEVAEQSKNMLNAMDDNMEGLEMNIYKLRKKEN